MFPPHTHSSIITNQFSTTYQKLKNKKYLHLKLKDSKIERTSRKKKEKKRKKRKKEERPSDKDGEEGDHGERVTKKAEEHGELVVHVAQMGLSP